MYRFVEHTAELELRIEAETPEDVFADALLAFAELVEDEGDGQPAEHEVAVEASDRATLLADWLGELIFLAETRRFVPQEIHSLELGERSLRARVAGRAGDPSALVKAVTYHGLELACRDGRWLARLRLDV